MVKVTKADCHDQAVLLSAAGYIALLWRGITRDDIMLGESRTTR